MGPQSGFSEAIHSEKYRLEGETFRDSMSRVAGALKDDADHFHQFRDALLNMRFLPGGRVQTAMGTAKHVTPYNCFVSGTIEDSFTRGAGSIVGRLAEAAETMRMGGGIGYDFSTLRPRGAPIRKLNSSSSGPISFMDIFDATGRAVASSGHRRGAQMGVLRVDHPDIEEFIRAKHNNDRLTGFNVSIAITDRFMECVLSGDPFELKFGGQVYREIDAQALWEMIMRSTWDWAEPGVLFIDRINQLNNLRYCETIAATNPCGEQPLPPYGACLLGSFNLTRYLSAQGRTSYYDAVNQLDVMKTVWAFDWDLFKHDIPVVVRAMDNIVDRASYPLYEQEKEAQSKRRMGLGLTGLANTGEALGWSYGSPEFVAFQREVMFTLARESYRASVDLAQEKGAFPLFDAERYTASPFLQQTFATSDSDLLERIARFGIRNSHLTSIAPTGTISMAADNVSSGIEPVFAYESERAYNMKDGPRVERLMDYGVKHLGVSGKKTSDVTIAEHLAVLSSAQMFVDSAVSKTCNVPADMAWEDFTNVYVQAWQLGCKGVTTFNTGGKRFGIMKEVKAEPDAAVCTVDPISGLKECG